jgi:periplasmic divalent cation tolerance protein
MITSEAIIVYVMTANKAEAERIASALLDEKLVACANILGSAASLFWWQGRVDRADEVLLMLKTRADLFEELSAKVKGLHSYEVPEIVALPIVYGDRPYLEWLFGSLKK